MASFKCIFTVNWNAFGSPHSELVRAKFGGMKKAGEEQGWCWLELGPLWWEMRRGANHIGAMSGSVFLGRKHTKNVAFGFHRTDQTNVIYKAVGPDNIPVTATQPLANTLLGCCQKLGRTAHAVRPAVIDRG